MSYFLRKSIRKRGLYLQIYESHYSKERKKTVTRFVATLGYHEDLKRIHFDPVEYGLSLVRAMNSDLPKKKLGKPRRAEMDNSRFVDIVRPLELLRQAMDGEEALPQLQERLSRVGDIAMRQDEEGQSMRRVLSRLWESHDPLLRGLMGMSHEMGLVGDIEEVGLFPLLTSEGRNLFLVAEGHFFPVSILDMDRASKSRSYLTAIKAEIPKAVPITFYGPSSAYKAIPENVRDSMPRLHEEPKEGAGSSHLAAFIAEARETVEGALPSECNVPSDTTAYFVFFAVLLIAFQSKGRNNPDVSF